MEYLINVWNCRAAVARREWSAVDQGYLVVPSKNWTLLEDAAIQAIDDVGGAINLSGQYPCPLALAEQGRWDDQ